MSTFSFERHFSNLTWRESSEVEILDHDSPRVKDDDLRGREAVGSDQSLQTLGPRYRLLRQLVDQNSTVESLKRFKRNKVDLPNFFEITFFIFTFN